MVQDRTATADQEKCPAALICYRYALQPVTALSEYAGRLHVSRALAANARAFVRTGEAVSP